MAHQSRTSTVGLDRLMGRLIDFEPGDDDGGGGGGGDDDKKFSQADVDRMIRDRLARDRKDRPSDDEITDLRDKAKKLEELEGQSKTDLQKLSERVEAAEKRAADAEAAREQALEGAKKTKLESAILAEAAKADRKVVDPSAVLALLDKSKLEVDDDGNPTNIAETMDALLDEKTYLVGGGSNKGRGADRDADQGARGGDGAKQLSSTDGMSSEEIATAASEGRLDEYLKQPK